MAVRTTTLVPREAARIRPSGLDAIDARNVDVHQVHVGGLLPAPGHRILARRKGRHELDTWLPPGQQRERLEISWSSINEHAERVGQIDCVYIGARTRT